MKYSDMQCGSLPTGKLSGGVNLISLLGLRYCNKRVLLKGLLTVVFFFRSIFTTCEQCIKRTGNTVLKQRYRYHKLRKAFSK